MGSLSKGPIGIFDSGYGGLSVFKEIEKELPEYDYIYLGDNARAPYGTRSFPTIYKYTWQSVQYLFKQGCNLVILACNTASAKALRNIQQINLKIEHPEKRVLGILRPTTEIIGAFSETKSIGILGTPGTIVSNSYPIEIGKFFPDIKVYQQACPMWVPLIENASYDNEGADFFIEQDVQALQEQSAEIDTILLACTHYPIIQNRIQEKLAGNIKVITQGEIVAKSLVDYLDRHENLKKASLKNGTRTFLTTGDVENFNSHSENFLGRKITAVQVDID